MKKNEKSVPQYMLDNTINQCMDMIKYIKNLVVYVKQIKKQADKGYLPTKDQQVILDLFKLNKLDRQWYYRFLKTEEHFTGKKTHVHKRIKEEIKEEKKYVDKIYKDTKKLGVI